MKLILGAAALPFLCALPASALDLNGNGQSDVWEMVHGVSGLTAVGDADRDGWTNAQESAAGTHPLDPLSHPRLSLERGAGGTFVASWAGLAGKKYTPLLSPTLAAGSWSPAAADLFGAGGTLQLAIHPAGAPRAFFRLEIGDRDLDGDGVADWEEYAIGFDPARAHSERRDEEDDDRVIAGLNAPSTITVSTYDDACSERWPDPALLVVRRAGGLKPLAVNVTFGGSATRNSDYTVAQTGSVVSFGPGTQEMLLNVPAGAVDDPYPNVAPLDPDALLRRLDLVLTGGTLRPHNFQIIREAMNRLGTNSVWDWPKERLATAISLIVASPEFAVLR